MGIFIQIEKNPNGSHAFQHGGTLQEGWAYWDTDAVPLPESFPWVDIAVEDVTHPEVKDEENGKVLEAEYKQMEVVSATDGEVIEVEPVVLPTQLDRIEAQVAYTAMMTETLLESEG